MTKCSEFAFDMHNAKKLNGNSRHDFNHLSRKNVVRVHLLCTRFPIKIGMSIKTIDGTHTNTHENLSNERYQFQLNYSLHTEAVLTISLYSLWLVLMGLQQLNYCCIIFHLKHIQYRFKANQFNTTDCWIVYGWSCIRRRKCYHDSKCQVYKKKFYKKISVKM